jgi:hypothetical protein
MMSDINDDKQGMGSGSDDVDAEGMEGQMGGTAAGMGSDTESDLDDDEMMGDTPGK